MMPPKSENVPPTSGLIAVGDFWSEIAGSVAAIIFVRNLPRGLRHTGFLSGP
jgi:hypothetical protein